MCASRNGVILFKDKMFFVLVLKFNSIRQTITNWVRQEVVDDDPYDVSTFFPREEKQDQ
ncbi:MAG: hypothetical protein Kow00121_65150 [Elainellaceae cyanobacterium]